ncbi:hypothetical protein ANO14919_095420 [Xylariales sp. No.14919]|nr:hypothetical protein F5X98DRAFT_70421 [Xylaria grammica]GAW20048.1 hypothetical protein ANO14919_095420 [Xylariales sp. No.14919]
MKINQITFFSTLALSACLSHAAVESQAVAAIGQGDVANGAVQVQGDVVRNNSTIADGADAVDQDENQDNEADEDASRNDNNNNNDNLDQILNGSLGDSFNDINIDPNDIQGSLGQNILNLLLSMGICNFNLNSLRGLSLSNEIQLLLQLQQIQQLQALGIVNSFAVDQLIQREILSQTFNLNIIKRSIHVSVKQAARRQKRTVMLRRQCANVRGSQGDADGSVDQDQAKQDQVNQEQNEQVEEKQEEKQGAEDQNDAE